MSRARSLLIPGAAHHQHAGSEPVQEVALPDRPELARSEEPGDRHAAVGLPHGADVVSRLSEQRLATAVAREEEHAGDVVAVLRAVALEHDAQVRARRLRVTHLELDRLPHLDHVADRDRAGRGINANDVPDEKVALALL